MADEKKYISKIKVNGETTPRLIKDSEARTLINGIDTRVETIENDYLKSADKTELSNAIGAEKTRAEGVEGGLQDQIDALVADAAKVASGEKIIGKNANKELTTTLGVKIEKKSDNKDYIVITGIDNAEVASVDASAFVKDGMIEKVELSKHDSKTFIKITFNTEAGKQPIELDVTELIDVYTAGNGIDVTGNVITAVAKSGDKYIEVTAAGIASKGIDAAIKVETDRAEAAEKAINDKIGAAGDDPQSVTTVYSAIQGLSNRLNTEETERGSADNALSNRIDALETDTHTHSNKAELDKIVSGDKAKWDAKQDALSFDGTYNASTNKVATVSTVTTETAKYLPLTGGTLTGNLTISNGGNGKLVVGSGSIESSGGSVTIKGGNSLALLAGSGNTTTTIENITVPKGTTGKTFATTDDITITGVKLNGAALTPDANKVVDLGSIATTTDVLDDASYTDATHKLVIHKGNGTNVVNHTFGALADKSSVSGTASITYTPTDITLNGTFTPSGTVSVTLKDAGVLSSVKSAGTLPTYSHTGFSGGSLGDASSSKFVKKTINAKIDSTDDECLEFFEVANTDTDFYANALTTQGTFTPATYGTDTFTQGAMPEFNSGTVGVASASFAGTEDQAISTSGQYYKADDSAAVSAN